MLEDSVPDSAEVISTLELNRYVPSLKTTVTSSPFALLSSANLIALATVFTGEACVPAALSLPVADTYIAESVFVASTGILEANIASDATVAIHFFFIFYSSFFYL